MKQKLFYTAILIFMIGFGTRAIACSPAHTPFDVYANAFTPDGAYYAVEGYYIDETTFMVTATSDSIIEVGKALPVYEYGPFGNMCEAYAMAVHINDNLIGKEHTRVLVLYKNGTSEEKLVTPIFQSVGISLNEEKAEFVSYKYTDKGYQTIKKSISQTTLYQRLFNGDKVSLVWDETIFKPST